MINYIPKDSHLSTEQFYIMTQHIIKKKQQYFRPTKVHAILALETGENIRQNIAKLVFFCVLFVTYQ